MTEQPDWQPSRMTHSADRNRPPAATPGVPRWVKTLIVVAVALVAVLVVVGLLTGGHSPGRHLGSDLVSTSGATSIAVGSSDRAATLHP